MTEDAGTPPGLRVVGGAGGTRARLDDLERCAAVLDVAAARLRELSGPSCRLGAAVTDASRWSPGTAPRATAAVHPLVVPGTGVAAAGDRAADAAARLRTVARGYASAEGSVLDLWRSGAAAGGYLLGRAGPVAWAGAGAAGGVAVGLALPRVLLLRSLRGLPGPWGAGAGVMLEAAGRLPGPAGWALRGPGLLPGPFSTRTGDLVVSAGAGFVLGAAPGHWLPGVRVPVPGGAAPGGLRNGAPLVGLPGLPGPSGPPGVPGLRPGAPARPLPVPWPLTVPHPRNGTVAPLPRPVPPPGEGLRLPSPSPGGPSGSPSGAPPSAVPGAARRLLGPLALLDGSGAHELVVTAQSPVPVGVADPPRDAVDLVASVQDTYPDPSDPAGTPPGSVDVLRYEAPDGQVSHVVVVPGTQSGALGGAVPNDMGSNMRLMAGVPDDVTEVLRRALDGIDAGPGEPILLVGHSQGGIAVVAAAADAAVRAGREVSVLTIGAPVQHVELPPDVEAVHLEITTDPVLATDGIGPRDRPNRVTIEVDPRRSDSPELRAAAQSWYRSHTVDTYALGLREAQDSGHPGVLAAVSHLESFLGPEGTTVTRQRFTGARVPAGTG